MKKTIITITLSTLFAVVATVGAMNAYSNFTESIYNDGYEKGRFDQLQEDAPAIEAHEAATAK